MTRDSLAILFSSMGRVRLLRLFIFNADESFGVNDILRRSKLSRRTMRTELNVLERAGVIKKKILYEAVAGRQRKRRVIGYGANPRFEHQKPLRAFLLDTAPIGVRLLEKYVRTIGRVDVLIATGVFMREFERRVDVLIATPKIQTAKVEAAIRNLEAELGVELRYTAFETKDFLYRFGMFDKLIRDVFDDPHQIVIDKVGVRDELQA